jgi:hypothetical protein
MKAAIPLIDLLEDYFQEGRLKANRSTLVSHINALTSVGRASHVPNSLGETSVQSGLKRCVFMDTQDADRRHP